MGRVVHFEITADDVDRATAFYASSFGWQTEESPFIGGYHLALTGAGTGIDGAVMERKYRSQPTIAWIQVDDIDATMEKVRAAGGEVEEKSAIPGHGQVVYVRDTEGNTIGLKQPTA